MTGFSYHHSLRLEYVAGRDINNAMGRRGIVRTLAVSVAALVITAVTACATGTGTIQPKKVDPQRYAGFDCTHLRSELSRLGSRAKAIGAEIDRTAEDDNTQAMVGVFFFFPALFLLEGGQTDKTHEYALIVGSLDALKAVSAEKNCKFHVGHAIRGSTKRERLRVLEVLRQDGLISPEEFNVRTKRIRDEE